MLFLTLSALAFVGFNAQAQKALPLENGYYVVVSTYKDSQVKEAKAYSEKLNKKGFQSGYGLEESKHFLYIYVASFNYGQFHQSLERMQTVRTKENFPTAWVLKIKDGKEIKEGDPVDEPPVEVAKKEEPKEPLIVTEYIPNPIPKPVTKPQHLGNTPVFFSVIQKNSKKVLEGSVKVVDTESNRVLGTVKTNAYFNIPDPRSKSGDITLVASVFGFEDVTQHMNYKETERDTLKDDVTLFGNFFMLAFEMPRMNSGTKATLSGVSFFNDAAIMTPASRTQLDNVLDMLNENPQMRIRIEGHTNGGGRGPIIRMGLSKNYFALTRDQQTEKGSSKELSQARAEIIKSWLVDQGIANSRVETLGWGGDKPIYDSKSNLARKNSRVELVVVD
ncbi:MAG: OmpA family protein [Bacteroidetes bacterium]|jgi:outer membrane protein OmpA-like peptidoglycan-associated protein|nr:OmpA family protein [Bacteroidota bacterium]MBS1980863.1 OmpA family protein [Bacteroidota bacterium]